MNLAVFDTRRSMRHVRTYPHPIARVWEAVTTPAHMDVWMVPVCQVAPRLGGPWAFSFANPDPARVVTGTITAWDPPRLVEYGNTNGGAMRFELAEEGGGTRLTFIQTFAADYPCIPSDDPGGDLPGGPDCPMKPGFVAGFHLMFDDLGLLLAGEPVADPMIDGVHQVHLGILAPDWVELCEIYRAHIRDTVPPA